MGILKRKLFAPALLIPILLIFACTSSADPKNEKERPEMNQLILELGKNIDDLGYESSGGFVQKNETAGLKFVKVSWQPPELGIIKIKNGSSKFPLPSIFSVTGLVDENHLNDGVLSFSVLAGLSPEESISHTRALALTNDLLKKILDAGWSPYTPRSRPRLTGQDRIRYALTDSASIGLDARTPLTLDQFLLLEDGTEWMFYSHDAYMDVSFSRDSKPEDKAGQGIYLLSISLKNAKDFYQGQVEPKDRENWRKTLPAMLKNLSEIRERREDELSSRGVNIDKAYQDPPVSY